MIGIPHVTVTDGPKETLTFADGTTVTRWYMSITRDDIDDDIPLWMENYLITSPTGQCHTTVHTYYEKR